MASHDAPRPDLPSPTPVRMSSATEWTLEALEIFPVKGAPGRRVPQATLTPSGLLGDRPKKRALLVATVEDIATTEARGEELRANIVLRAPSAALQGATGHELRIGDAVVRIERKPSACDGMYAEVVEPGELLVGDRCRLE